MRVVRRERKEWKKNDKTETKQLSDVPTSTNCRNRIFWDISKDFIQELSCFCFNWTNSHYIRFHNIYIGFHFHMWRNTYVLDHRNRSLYRYWYMEPNRHIVEVWQIDSGCMTFYCISFVFISHSCPFLHRTAGDTERRYHLRYYKTCMCVHDTDSRGYCVKNGHHCAFAHGIHDQRPPVYDIKELESLQNAESNNDAVSGPNALDKERSLMNEDPKWQDTNYVLANYKTEPCKRPPRLCRQGYACPQYHNSKDKRRSPRKFKYRSTPCPNVKHSEEWGEPANCEAGDNCQYCHTRTEQQFHPEIYKSTKCNDVQQAGYCPRSVFCAFAHVERKFDSWLTLHMYYVLLLSGQHIHI